MNKGHPLGIILVSFLIVWCCSCIPRIGPKSSPKSGPVSINLLNCHPDLAKSKSASKVGAQSQKPLRKPEVVEEQEPRLSKCLSGDTTLLLSAAGDCVASQADTFQADDDDNLYEDDLISDEDVPDLETAYVTAVSGMLYSFSYQASFGYQERIPKTWAH